MHRLLLFALVLLLVACGGGTAAPAAKAVTEPTAAAKPTAAPASTNTPVPPKPTDTPKPPPATPTEWVINGVTVKDADCKISHLCITPDKTLAVRVTEVLASETTTNQFIKPQPGNTFLLVNVYIGYFGDKSIAYNPLYAKVKDETGREYPSNVMAAAAITGGLQSGTLTPGNNIVQGVIAFEVPKGAGGWKLTYQPLIFPQPPPIVIQLGQ